MKNIKFVVNDLGNYSVLSSDDLELDGFIKHIELFKTDEQIIHLNINEEEFAKTNNVYFHIRYHRRMDITLTINQLKEVFQNKNIYYEILKHKKKIMILDLFLYE